DQGVGILPWSPLARGFLAGNRDRGGGGETTRAKSDDFAHRMYYEESDFRVVERVEDIAEQRGVTPAQVSLAWLLQQPGVTAPIIGATKMDHLEQAVEALEVTLSEEELTALDEVYVPHPVLGHD
ncbi:MAG: aldo/keto reductase, partial [Anaerolineales bacterium]|nr:aldo/keto reductase [Anaerolineales bacterium]